MSMVTIDAGKAVVAMAEAALTPGSEHSLYVRVEVQIYATSVTLWQGKVRPRLEAETEANTLIEAWHGDPDDAPWPDDLVVSQSVHFLFRRPTHNRQVFACRDESWSTPKPEAFVFLSEHDSCWRNAVDEPLNEAVRYLSEKLEALGVSRDLFDLPRIIWPHVARVISTTMRNFGVDYGPGRYSLLSLSKPLED